MNNIKASNVHKLTVLLLSMEEDAVTADILGDKLTITDLAAAVMKANGYKFTSVDDVAAWLGLAPSDNGYALFDATRWAELGRYGEEAVEARRYFGDRYALYTLLRGIIRENTPEGQSSFDAIEADKATASKLVRIYKQARADANIRAVRASGDMFGDEPERDSWVVRALKRLKMACPLIARKGA